MDIEDILRFKCTHCSNDCVYDLSAYNEHFRLHHDPIVGASQTVAPAAKAVSAKPTVLLVSATAAAHATGQQLIITVAVIVLAVILLTVLFLSIVALVAATMTVAAQTIGAHAAAALANAAGAKAARTLAEGFLNAAGVAFPPLRAGA